VEKRGQGKGRRRERGRGEERMGEEGEEGNSKLRMTTFRTPSSMAFLLWKENN
jgi:hypothetical protein